jgi:Domain of unknown function (DUF4440)
MRPDPIRVLAQDSADLAATEGRAHMDDTAELGRLNEQFIEAFREGSWALLEPILSPRFQYLDGTNGEVWPMEKYIHNLDGHASPELSIDEVVIHVDGDTAVVSARTSRRPTDRDNRYVDTYERRDGAWRCVHACVWPLKEDD